MRFITDSSGIGTAVTTAVLFCGVAVYGQIPNISSMTQHAYDPLVVDYGLSLDSRYHLIPKDNSHKNSVEAINVFASNLLDNIEDIPSEFNQAVDENFWSLI